jgi:hypothetical protein
MLHQLLLILAKYERIDLLGLALEVVLVDYYIALVDIS